MRNFIIWTVLFILSLLFQTTIINSLAAQGIRPNLSLSVFVIFALRHSPLKSQSLGFAFGLLEDLTSSSLLGMNAFAKSLIGYTISSLNLSFKFKSFASQIITLLLATILNGLVFLLLCQLFLFSISYHNFLKIVSYEALLNMIIFPFLFWGINSLTNYNEKDYL